MYQQELFKEVARRRLHRLGSGVNGEVWDCGRSIIKVSKNSDGTRNWVEFCLMHTEAGTLMPLMPEVYSVVDCWGDEEKRWCSVDHRYKATGAPRRGYVVAMKKYRQQPNNRRGAHFWGTGGGTGIDQHGSFKEVAEAFREYMLARCGEDMSTYVLFIDCHTGNIVMDGNKPIIIDPSNSAYKEPTAPDVLVLEMQ